MRKEGNEWIFTKPELQRLLFTLLAKMVHEDPEYTEKFLLGLAEMDFKKEQELEHAKGID